MPYRPSGRGVNAAAAADHRVPSTWRRYAAVTAWARSRRPSLIRMRLTWVFTVVSAMVKNSAISALERPWATNRSTSRSRA